MSTLYFCVAARLTPRPVVRVSGAGYARVPPGEVLGGVVAGGARTLAASESGAARVARARAAVTRATVARTAEAMAAVARAVAATTEVGEDAMATTTSVPPPNKSSPSGRHTPSFFCAERVSPNEFSAFPE